MHTPDFLIDRLVTGQRFTLEPLRETLERLGHPERSVPTVLIGGTNGKGSTQAFLASILRAGGHRVGTFTSPSLADFRELVRIDRASLTDPATRSMAEEILAAAGPAGLTLFELATALAFLAFARAGIDLAVVEVGMGGRQDATNLCEPMLSIVTQVALDHQAELGGTLEAIAAEKVGIARAGRPLITGATGDALRTLLSACDGLGTPVDVAGRDFWMEAGEGGLRFVRVSSGRAQGQDCRIAAGEGGLTFAGESVGPVAGNPTDPGGRSQGEMQRLEGLEISLAGVHQPGNAGLAIQAALRLSELGWAVDEGALRRGLRSAYIPGRLEWIAGADGLRVLVDGAHNPHGAAALARSIALMGLPRPRLLALAVFADKDLEGMLAALLPEIDGLIATRTQAARCLPPEELARRARAVVGPDFALRIAPGVGEAVAMFRGDSAAMSQGDPTAMSRGKPAAMFRGDSAAMSQGDPAAMSQGEPAATYLAAGSLSLVEEARQAICGER